MTIGSAVVAARRFNDKTLTDSCVITREDPAGEPEWNPETGETTTPSVTVHTALPCRLREPSAADRATVAGEHQFQQGDAILRLSATYSATAYEGGTVVSGPLRIGDSVTITSPQGIDMGQQFTVVWPMSGSHMSSARFVVRKVL